MRKKSFIMAALASFIAFSSLPSFAAKPINVLVIDSGSDFTHKELKPMASPNLAELKGTEKVDDDNNGYVDDVYGWNFVENNSTLVNLREKLPRGNAGILNIRLSIILSRGYTFKLFIDLLL